ncbi:MAG: NUDIX hydrolase N-terminal domain-containing protein [Anaerolineae bacterium]
MPHHEPDWLRWAKELQARSPTGLTFTKDHYDIQNATKRSITLAAEMMTAGSGSDLASVLEVFTQRRPAMPRATKLTRGEWSFRTARYY